MFIIQTITMSLSSCGGGVGDYIKVMFLLVTILDELLLVVIIIESYNLNLKI